VFEFFIFSSVPRFTEPSSWIFVLSSERRSHLPKYGFGLKGGNLDIIVPPNVVRDVFNFSLCSARKRQPRLWKRSMNLR